METEVETFSTYLKLIPSESPLAVLCKEIAKDEMIACTDVIHVGLESGLVTMVAGVIWPWAKLYYNAQRNRIEFQEAELQIAMILELQKKGYSRKDSERLVENTLNAIRKRNKEDPAIKSLLQIASKVLISTQGGVEDE